MPRKTKRSRSQRRQGIPGGGMGGNFGGVSQQDLMRQMQQYQEEMAENDISDQEFTATSGGGMVTVVANGNFQVQSIEIKPEILDPDDPEFVQDLIMAAFNDLYNQLEAARNAMVDKMSKGLNLPPGLLG